MSDLPFDVAGGILRVAVGPARLSSRNGVGKEMEIQDPGYEVRLGRDWDLDAFVVVGAWPWGPHKEEAERKVSIVGRAVEMRAKSRSRGEKE